VRKIMMARPTTRRRHEQPTQPQQPPQACRRRRCCLRAHRRTGGRFCPCVATNAHYLAPGLRVELSIPACQCSDWPRQWGQRTQTGLNL